MAALTRIFNNQIYNSTIIGYQKIAAGTITGSLFASNVTVPGDLLIAGNLFVLGSSAYTTIASTNTYVNDPLVVLNNGFSGTNNRDIGLVLNRGTDQNQAIVWSESNDEFRFIGTTETGTTYGSVVTSTFANVNLGNLTVQWSANVSSLQASGNLTSTGGIVTAGDLAVNGGDITTSSSTATVFNATATTVSAFQAATTLGIGANSGTLTIGNPTVVGTQTTQALYNTTATTMNFAGAATTLTAGAATGLASIRNQVINFPNLTNMVTDQTSINVFNANVTTLNLAGAVTDLTIGSTAGTANIRLGNVNFTNATVFYAQQPQIDLFNAPRIVNSFTGAETANIATSATWLNLGATSGTLNIQSPNVYGTQATQNLYTSANTTTMNFALSSANMNIGATAGTANILLSNISYPNATTFSASQATIGVFNTPTTVTAFNAATSITLGANNAGNLIVRNDILFIQNNANVNGTRDATTTTSAALTVAGGAAVKAGMIVGGTFYANASAGSTQQNSGIGAIVIPTGGISVGGTANIAGYTQINGATQLNNTLTVGGIEYISNTTNATEATGSSGALQIKGGVSIAKDLHIGGNIYASNIFSTTYQVITVQDPLLYLDAANTYPYNFDIGFYSNFVGPNPIDDTGNVYQHTGLVRDDTDNTWKFFSNVRTEPSGAAITFDADTIYDPVKAGNLVLTYTQAATSATTGALQVGGGAGIGGNIFQTGAYHDTSSTNGLLFNTPTTVDAFKSASTLNVGANSGTLTIGNPTVVGTQSTQTLYNTTATTLNFGGAATTLVVGATSGVAHLRNANIWVPNATTLDGAQADIQLFTQSVTNANVLIKANVILGANVGTTTIQNPTLVGTQATQNVYNTIATTVNAFGAATTLTLGATNSGNLIIRNNSLFIQNNANVNGTRDATTTTSAALTVAGGAAVKAGMIVGGTLYANSTAKTTTSTGTGAIVVPTGGASVFGNVYIGEKLFIGPNTAEVAGTSTFSGLVINSVGSNQSFVQIALGNNDNRGSTDYAAYASDGSDTGGWVDMGFTGNAFSDANYTITKSHDGYLFARSQPTFGGNLVLATSEAGVYNDIVLGVGSFLDTAEVARFHGNVGTSGNAWIKYQTVSTTPNNGALRVDGGVGIRGNIRVGGGAVFNNSQTADPFQVKGVATTSLIYADTAQGAVVIGGSNVAPQLGSTLKINGVDSLLLPIGTTGQRPGATGNIDLAGMIRFNTTIQNMEFYDGSQWQTAGSVFTVISDRQFTGNVGGGYGNVDGTNTTFTIQANSTTSGTIVSINGVIQFPVLAYDVSGTTLTFTEPPAPDDVIDVRVLATTSTISSLSNGNGLNQVIAGNDGVQIWTGTSATVERVLVNQVGDVNLLDNNKLTYTQTAVNIAANNTPYVIASYSQSAYTTAKFLISAKKGTTNFQSMESMITTDGAGNAYITTYAVVNNGADMGGITANVVGGNVQVYWTTTTNVINANVKAFGTYIV